MMIRLNILSFLALILMIACRPGSSIEPVDLVCEYIQNPKIVDHPSPRLSWINVANPGIRGQSQTAYQIRVSSEKKSLQHPDLWDSGVVRSIKSNRIAYNGNPLKTGMTCWWQVRVWDRDQKPSSWSEPAYWKMGILQDTDWRAKWIGAPWQGEKPLPKPGWPGAPIIENPPPAPYFRKEFAIAKSVRKATAYVTGLGYFEAYVNGKKMGDEVLVPNQTNYGKRPNLMQENIPLPDNFREYKVMYMSYDLTESLISGQNALGLILGNGFYNSAKYWTGSYGTPRFLAQIHIEYADGTTDQILSDESWKTSKGPILMDMVYYGEIYDARLEQPGWNLPGFDDSQWINAASRLAPLGKLVAHTPHPDKVNEQLSPVSIEKLENGNHRVDFGKEISGWVRLNEVQASPGHEIQINFLSNLYSGENKYIFRGQGPESYAPRFNWFVFKEIEISNWPGDLLPEHLVAESVHTYIDESSEFETSNSLFNEIHKIWKQSQVDNMHGGIASDCPHRERNGYTGDGQVACVTVMHNYDARSFYEKWIRDMIGSQNPETGYVPNCAPWEPGCGGGVAWGAAICIMPWEFFVHYGNMDILEESYDAMKGYVNYMKTWISENGIMHSKRKGHDDIPLRWFNLGDWACVNDECPPDEMVHTFYYWRCAEITSKTAEILGKHEEAAQFQAIAEKCLHAFRKHFYNPQDGTYGPNGGNIFALKMGVPENQLANVITALKNELRETEGHLFTGIFGTQFFFEVLTDHGLHTEAYKAMNKKTEPSYGHWIELGSTTTREHWDNRGSHNHPMFGGGIVWFYRKLAGMMADPGQPGYRHIIFKPHPAGDLTFVKYYNKTPVGRAGIEWNREGDQFSMNIEVPVGSSASVYVPAEGPDYIAESGIEANKSSFVDYVGMEDGYAIFSVGSGRYEFSVPLE